MLDAIRRWWGRLGGAMSADHVPEDEARRTLRLLHGDRAGVERLIAGELTRRPGISRREANRRVQERLLRDQG